MKKQHTEYGDESIQALKGAERVRLKPGVMFGSDNLKGAFHTFKEILGNSLDEVRGGHGDIVEVVYYTDGAISVRDFGRGVPMGWNKKEGEYNWHLVFNELYAGGKYGDSDEAYKFSLGLNGLGAAAVQYTSEYFEVKSYRDGKVFTKCFREGEPVGQGLEEDENKEGEKGTYIKWKVDNKVFRETNFKFSQFLDYCKGQAHISKAIIRLRDENTEEEVEYEGRGVREYLSEQVGESLIKIISKTSDAKGVEDNGQEYAVECEVCLALTEETKGVQLYFHNTAEMNTGHHAQAVQEALQGFFKNIGKQNKVNILPYDYNDYLSILVSTYSNITSFANQTKDGVDNKFVYDIIYKTVTDILEEGVAKEDAEIQQLVENVITSALARKKAKEIEMQERDIKKATSRKEEAEKYVDCGSSDPKKKELFILEGDSALGSCKSARDAEFQALLPSKGKTLNCLKCSIQEAIENRVVKDIVATVGTGIDLGEGSTLFDISKLQFDKIIILTDADTDGFQIRVLIYSIFARLMPKLLEMGKVYIAETPLYEIEVAGEKVSRFAYSVEEKEKILKEIEEKGQRLKKVDRSKGLGENDADMMWHTTMNPKTRRLVQLKHNPTEKQVSRMTDMLFGEDKGKERKDYIFKELGKGVIDIEETREACVVIGEAV